MNLWKLIPHRHIYRLGDYSGKRCRRCGRFRNLEQKEHFADASKKIGQKDVR